LEGWFRYLEYDEHYKLVYDFGRGWRGIGPHFFG
jgi:hypothetical protein